MNNNLKTPLLLLISITFPKDTNTTQYQHKSQISNDCFPEIARHEDKIEKKTRKRVFTPTRTLLVCKYTLLLATRMTPYCFSNAQQKHRITKYSCGKAGTVIRYKCDAKASRRIGRRSSLKFPDIYEFFSPPRISGDTGGERKGLGSWR